LVLVFALATAAAEGDGVHHDLIFVNESVFCELRHGASAAQTGVDIGIHDIINPGEPQGGKNEKSPHDTCGADGLRLFFAAIV
jgi:hypothetical protein